MSFCYKMFLNLYQTSKKCEYVMLETLSGKFNVILLMLPLLEGLHISFCGLYIVVFGNRSAQKSPWGGGL